MKKLLALSLAAAISLSLLTGCTPAQPTSPTTTPVTTPAPAPVGSVNYADTIAWDGRYDVVVVGFGGAGAVAAKTAADEGAKVLLLEKAPEGHEGGNTRYCGQLVVGSTDYDKALAYYKALFGPFEVSDAMLETFVRGVVASKDTLINDFGVPADQVVSWGSEPSAVSAYSPEYPELEGGDSILLYTISEELSNGVLWQMLRQHIVDRPDSVDVWFESPATRLIQDPQSMTIVGVQVQRAGETLNIRATNGVVLATGGFENNPVMVEDYLGLPHAAAIGGLYNTGDGVKMAMDVGADLWHMDAFEGISVLGGSSFMVAEGERAVRVRSGSLTTGSSVLLAADGSRYLREDETTRHGHIYEGGIWQNVNRPLRSFVFFDQAQYDVIAEAKGIPEEYQSKILKADTMADMAAQTDMDPAIMADTIAKYNTYAKTGVDLEFGRLAKNMKSISEAGPYYAIEIMPAILNTQGGPRRNENAEVLSTAGTPIPHLYSAGELGGITALHYQGASNIAECFIFGKLAGENAAAGKGELPEYTLPVKTESTLQFTPGKVTDLAAATGDTAPAGEITVGENEYVGVSSNAMGGELKVKITMDGDKLAKVEVVEQKETVGIGDKAIAALPDAMVAANSTEVDIVAGATITSKAIQEAVTDALSQVK